MRKDVQGKLRMHILIMKKNKVIAIEVVLVSIIIILAYWILTKDYLPFDKPVMNFFYNHRTPGMNTLVESLTYLGNWEAITVIVLLLLAFDTTRVKYGYSMAIAAIGSTILNKLLKIIVRRPRPESTMFLIEQGGFSFPSGHATAALAVYGLLIYLVLINVRQKNKRRQYIVLLVIAMIAICISRMYLGVHYPSDIIGGICVGAIVMAACIWKNKAICGFFMKYEKSLD